MKKDITTKKNEKILISTSLYIDDATKNNSIDSNYLNLLHRLKTMFIEEGYEVIQEQDIEKENLQNNFDRIKKVYEAADIIVFLPGGIKSISSLFAIIEENQSNPTPKNIILLNYESFYEKLLDMIYCCISKNFTDDKVFEYFTICKTEEDILLHLNMLKKQKKLTFNQT